MVRSSPSTEQLEVAGLLARRAAGDLRAAQTLAPDLEIDEGVVGFHAQQAVEKALKVSLTLRGVDFPKTHDIDFLVGLARRHEIVVPSEIAAAGWLTPWAAEFRYDDAPLESLDRGLAVDIAESAVTWCSERITASTQ